MDNELRESVEKTIKDCLRKKFSHYKPKDNYMPFHHKLLGRDRYALYSFIHSLNTTFGSSVFEPVAVSLARGRFAKAECQYVVGDELYSDCRDVIENIMSDLQTAKATPDKSVELQLLRQSLSGEKRKSKPTRVDLYLVDNDGVEWLFDMKSPKPNVGEFKGFKRTILEWSAVAMTTNSNVDVRALVAFTYNPFYPEHFQSWQMRGVLELDDVLIEKEFWDFLGGEGSYEELLDCFERVGIEMRDEIDDYFKRFNV
ncbi:MAG: TdeIII family type II restriction endonuclease [Zoogloeaceae bacterium]|jgi:type II restriction enzyme|nr:TdeIII family type II restriction endonuclease [Zoogloeaceae bacterium]